MLTIQTQSELAQPRAVIVGGGGAIGIATAQALKAKGYRVLSTTRERQRLVAEAQAAAGEVIEVEVTSASALHQALHPFQDAEILVYNAGRIDLAPLQQTSNEMFLSSLLVNAAGAFYCAKVFAEHMVQRGRGHMIFVGATASVRGGARSHAFAAGKHALRGLAASLAKELGPCGVHVAHLVIDGKVWGERTRQRFAEVRREQCLEAEAVAQSICALLDQPRSAWTFELDLRPCGERWT